MWVSSSVFLSTLSVRRATFCRVDVFPFQCISIHALREESDNGRYDLWDNAYISIHALREESDCVLLDPISIYFFISIHALREESDLRKNLFIANTLNISIHALREESDRSLCEAGRYL